jgi:TolA-binding protein
MRNSMMKKIVFAACALVMLGGVAGAQRGRTAGAAGSVATSADPADSLFRIGRTAVSENDYRRAATLFKQVVDKYPKATKAGDALYWRAYALHRLGIDNRSKSDLQEALTAIDLQAKSYPTSANETGGAVLRVQIRSAQASLGDATAAAEISSKSQGVAQSRACTGSKADEEMRLAAMDGLISMNAEDAMPILKEVLKQRDTCKVELRKRAVWLVSQKRTQDAALTLLDVARNDPSSEVRGEAVWWMGQSGSDLAVPLLDSVLFSSSTDEEDRKRASHALSQLANRNDRARQSLRRAAEDEKLPEDLRADVIFWLGQGGLMDVEYFKALFAKTRSREMREKIMFAVGQRRSTEASSWLLSVARDKTVDVETRKNALFSASQQNGLNLEALSAIYDQSKGEDEIQDHVVWLMSQRREPAVVDKLIDIAKNDPNLERRKNAMFWLGQKKNDPRVSAFFRDLITRP